MTTYRLQSSLQDKSQLARDQYVNSIYVESLSIADADMTGWCNAFSGFYDALHTYFSPCIDINAQIKVYEVGAPKETPPKHVQPWYFVSGGGSPYPLEVACCLSFKGAPHTGWQLQSTRGRIYLGPLCAAAGSESSNDHVSKPLNTFRTAAVAAATAMAAAIKAANGSWVVYSKLHSAVTPVTSVQVDNEWDTVRSRGHRADQKSVGAITP